LNAPFPANFDLFAEFRQAFAIVLYWRVPL